MDFSKPPDDVVIKQEPKDPATGAESEPTQSEDGVNFSNQSIKSGSENQVTHKLSYEPGLVKSETSIVVKQEDYMDTFGCFEQPPSDEYSPPINDPECCLIVIKPESDEFNETAVSRMQKFENKITKDTQSNEQNHEKCEMSVVHERLHSSHYSTTNEKSNVVNNTDVCDKSPSVCHQSENQTRSAKKPHASDWPFVCPTCSKGFISAIKLDRHLKTHASRGRPFVCPTCLKGYLSSSEFSKHLRVHTGEQPFVCPTCGKRFTESKYLSQHLRTHKDERPFICPTCNKGFKQKEALSKHLRTHTGEKPFECPTCGQRFSQSSALDRHFRTHTGERPYICTTCKKGFGSSSELTKHLKRKELCMS